MYRVRSESSLDILLRSTLYHEGGGELPENFGEIILLFLTYHSGDPIRKGKEDDKGKIGMRGC